MLHKISIRRREMGDNSFLRDFKARIFSSRRAMSRSMILRVTSNGSPAKHEVSVSSMENTIGFLVEKKTCLEPCDLFNTEEARASAKLL